MADLIDRQELLRIIDQRILNKKDARKKHSALFVEGMEDGYLRIRSDVCQMPSAEWKKGKWIRNDNGTYSCSLCQSWIPEEQYYYARFCLYCGADMRGEQDECFG